MDSAFDGQMFRIVLWWSLVIGVSGCGAPAQMSPDVRQATEILGREPGATLAVAHALARVTLADNGRRDAAALILLALSMEECDELVICGIMQAFYIVAAEGGLGPFVDPMARSYLAALGAASPSVAIRTRVTATLLATWPESVEARGAVVRMLTSDVEREILHGMEAIRGIRLLPCEDLIAVLVALLNHELPGVRRAAIYACAWFDWSWARLVARPYLDDVDDGVRSAAREVVNLGSAKKKTQVTDPASPR